MLDEIGKIVGQNVRKISIWSVILFIVIIIVFLVRHCLPIRDGDVFFHILYGRYIIEMKTLIPDHTVFSWTPSSNDTIYCTWLPDIILYSLYKLFGLTSLFVVRYVCMAALIIGCIHFSWKKGNIRNPLVWFICLVALVMSYTASYAKPEVLTYSLTVFCAWNWWHIRHSGERAWRNCYFFPLLFLIWVNSHGAFVFGAAFLFLIGLGELLNTWWSPHNTLPEKTRKHFLIALILSAVTPFLTPYGYHYPLQLIADFMPTAENLAYNGKIAAYVSPFADVNPYNFVLCADIAIVMLAFLYISNFRKIEWSSLLTNLLFAFLFTKFFRTTFFWAPIFMFSSISLLPAYPVLGLKRQMIWLQEKVIPVAIVFAGVALAADTLHLSFTKPERGLWVGFGISDNNPVSEAKYIKKYFPKNRIGNTYNQGAYLLWEIWPENKVFFDGRHFPYKKWSDEYFSFADGEKVKDILDKYDIDVWCIGYRHNKLIAILLSTQKWKPAFYGNNAVVLIKEDFPLPGGKILRSEDFFEPTSLYSASLRFTYACTWKDWETAKRLLDVIQNNFNYKNAEIAKNWSYNIYHGMRNFYSNRLSEALPYFVEAMDGDKTYTRYYLVTCYHFMTREKWEDGDLALAYHYAELAQKTLPDDFFSLYNLGVIGWRIWTDSLSRPGVDLNSEVNSSKRWRDYLRRFIALTNEYKEGDEYRQYAMTLLGNEELTGDLKLLLPPLPRKEVPGKLKLPLTTISKGNLTHIMPE